MATARVAILVVSTSRSRGVAGTRGRSLIVNFPGSPESIGQAGAAIVDALPQALRLLADETAAH